MRTVVRRALTVGAAALAVGLASVVASACSNGSRTAPRGASTSTTGAARTTTTLPSAAKPFHVAAVGDMVCPPGSAVTAATCQQMGVSGLVARDPALGLFLPLGDLQYGGGGLHDFRTSYARSYGRVKGKTRPVIGNHEYEVADARAYFTYFGRAAGDPAKGYYSFDVGDTWHVVVLNGNCTIVACAVGSAQERWLRADLAASSRACVLAAWHQPRFSSVSRYGDDPAVVSFWDVLQANRAELVLDGHAHNYERFAPQLPDGRASAAGIREFVVGTGGYSLDGFGTPHPNSARRISSFGVLRLILRDHAYSWSFVDEAGAVLDSGTATCH